MRAANMLANARYRFVELLQELALAAFVMSVLWALLLVVAARPSSPLHWPEYYLGSLYVIGFAACAWNGRRQPKR